MKNKEETYLPEEEEKEEQAEDLDTGEPTERQDSSSGTISDKNALVSYDPLQLYLMQVKKYDLLSREEEERLAIKAKEEKDPWAIQRLITANLRLVIKIAMDFQRYWTKNLLDLIQEGNLGLMQAVRKFDPYRGIKFSYYASFWIKAYILKFIMDNWKLVKIGTTQSQRKLFFNMAKERDRLIAQGFDPEPRLLAERLDVKEDVVVEMSQRLGAWEVSLDAPVGEDSRESYEALLPDPGKGTEQELYEDEGRDVLSKKLSEFRKTLSEKETDIFDNRIMSEDPLTLKDLGEKYNISRERVRQIQEKIIEKCKKWLTEKIPNFEQEYSDFME